MIVVFIVLAALLATRAADVMRGLFLCLAFALSVNLFFVFNGSATIVTYGEARVNIGYEGYFGGETIWGDGRRSRLCYHCTRSSIWLAPNSPSAEAGGWVKMMP